MEKWIKQYSGLGMLVVMQICIFIVLIMSLSASGEKVSFAYIPTLFLLLVVGVLINTFREQNLRLKKIENELAQLKEAKKLG